MTRLVIVFLRFVGGVVLAVSNEIDRAVSDYKIEDVVPDTVPLWLDEEVDLP